MPVQGPKLSSFTRRQIKMTQLHFTLKTEAIQNLIEKSVKDDGSKNILMTVFNQLMEEQRTQYLQAKDYEHSNHGSPNERFTTKENGSLE